MFLIFGIKDHKKDYNLNFRITCTNCFADKHFTIIKHSHCFHLFFIPIFYFGAKYFAVCKNCDAVYKIDKQTAKQIINNPETPVNSSEFEKVESEYIICQSCGAKASKGDNFCSNCGGSLKN